MIGTPPRSLRIRADGSRPLGASFADWLGVPAPYGDGLQLGTGPMSLLFGAVLIVVVGTVAVRHRRTRAAVAAA